MNKILISLFSIIFAAMGAEIWLLEKRGTKEIKEVNLSSLQKVLPSTQIDQVLPSVIPGVHEVIAGDKVLYVAQDRYLLIGHIYDLKEVKDLTQERKDSLKSSSGNSSPKNSGSKIIQDLGGSLEQSEIAARIKELTHLSINSNANTGKTLYVFSDPQCGYCQKLHAELAGNAAVNLVELMYPILPGSMDIAANILCSDNPKSALSAVMSGDAIGMDTDKSGCLLAKKEELQSSLSLGRQLNVQGTPTIFTEDGRRTDGYMPAPRIIDWLNSK